MNRRPMNRPATSRWNDDYGMLSTELALLVPIVLVGFVSLITLAGRLVQAETEMASAAQEAARTASLANTFAQAADRASASAAANLATAGLSCAAAGPTVVTTTSAGAVDLEPGAIVTVEVTCTADLADVTHLGIPGTKSFTATAHEIVDVHRSSP